MPGAMRKRRLTEVIRIVAYMPFFGLSWYRALGAAERKDWKRVAQIMEALHSRRLATDDTRFWLRSAYAKMERRQKALQEFEKIASLSMTQSLRQSGT